MAIPLIPLPDRGYGSRLCCCAPESVSAYLGQPLASDFRKRDSCWRKCRRDPVAPTGSWKSNRGGRKGRLPLFPLTGLFYQPL